MKKIPSIAAICLFAFFSPSLSKAASISYTLTGGLISGTLGGTAFSAANWTITATTDSSAAQFLPQGGSIWAPVWYQVVTPVISIVSGSSVLTATLTGTGTGQWFLESRDYSIFGNPTYDGGLGFFYARSGEVMDGNGAYVGGQIGFNNLQTTGTVNGQSGFDSGNGPTPGFYTSVGELLISSNTQAAGTFVPQVSTVPEPSSHLAILGLVSSGLLLRRRRTNEAQTAKSSHPL